MVTLYIVLVHLNELQLTDKFKNGKIHILSAFYVELA